jgi:hypothetical protein
MRNHAIDPSSILKEGGFPMSLAFGGFVLAGAGAPLWLIALTLLPLWVGCFALMYRAGS